MSDYRNDPATEQDDDDPPYTMEPLRRSPLIDRQRVPLTPRREPIRAMLENAQAEVDEASEEADTDLEIVPPVVRPYPIPESRPGYRDVDPIFAYLLLIALAIGLSSFDPTLRYVMLWTLMGGLGAMAYLLGAVQRMREAVLDDLIRGFVFGMLSSLPFLLVFGASLETVSIRMFNVDGTPGRVMDSWVFMAVAFVIPSAETLFFRGALQGVRDVFFTTILATLWSCVIFFPVMGLSGRLVIAGVLLIVFSLLNFLYSYVRLRNGLAGAWLCQTVSYSLLWFFPRILF